VKIKFSAQEACTNPECPEAKPGFTIHWHSLPEWSEEIETMNFGEALENLKQGKLVTRRGWNGRGMWLALQRPDADSKMTLPYIYMRTVHGDFVPWLASQTDMLAEDWEPA